MAHSVVGFLAQRPLRCVVSGLVLALALTLGGTALAAPKGSISFLAPALSNVDPMPLLLLGVRDVVPPPTAAEVGATVQLWDLSHETLVAATVEVGLSASSYRLVPSQPLVVGRDYGVRVVEDAPWEGEGPHGELGRFHVGSRPRVTSVDMGPKGFEIFFSEPMTQGALAAVSLTNTATGKDVAMSGTALGREELVYGAVFELPAAIDTTAPHRLRIAASAPSVSGAPFDGSAGIHTAPSDFVVNFSAEQLTRQQGSLFVTCYEPRKWWDAARQVGVATPEACAMIVAPALPPDDSARGCVCAVGDETAPPWSMLLALVALLVVRRRQ